MIDLPLLSAGIIAVGVIIYVVLDGFDLGIGVLLPFARTTEERNRMMASIAPVWDGNETWLILGGVVLFAAFPVAYAVALPALYIPIVAMLFSFIFRGVAFEFRANAKPGRGAIWTFAFCAGSIGAAICQGLILGGLIEGLVVKDRQFAGGPFDWASWFGLIAAGGMLAGYALLGACWVILKTDDQLQRRAFAWAKVSLIFMLLFMGAISIATPIFVDAIAERWFGGVNLVYLSPVPVITLLVAALLWSVLERESDAWSFRLAVGLFLLGYAGLAISMWPYIVPRELTIWQAAADPESQRFVLIACAFSVPMIIAYTIYAYRVFRGKVPEGETYGH